MSSHRSSRERTIFQPFPNNSATSHGGKSLSDREKTYRESITDPSSFWSNVASSDFYWKSPWTTTLSFNFHRSKGQIDTKWFAGGRTNMCYNCVDRWLPQHANRVAFYWEGNEPSERISLTYLQLHNDVCVLATLLKSKYGVRKGTCVTLYLPQITLGPIAMLALARIGAICNVVFGAFSSHALSSRMIDSKATLLITADCTVRGDKAVHLKKVADEALIDCEKAGVSVKCLVFDRHSRIGVVMKEGRDAWLRDELKEVAAVDRTVEWMDAEDILFYLYTSGSTGKPKGLVHTVGGYMVFVGTTFKFVFDYHPSDVYFCTADIGWITGHSYITFGPLLNCATSVLYEGLPAYPTPSRWWEIVDRYNVSIFYTAPTAIRSLIKVGNEHVTKTSRKSLRVLGSVGEPIDVEAWEWYYRVVGNSAVDVCDTWWQTETGGHMLTPLAGNTPTKPGSATLPVFGVVPVVLSDKNFSEISGEGTGLLCIGAPWPGLARTILGDHQRYESTYFSHDGYYFSGDGCRRDEDGYYWLTGRMDDVLNVSGHRLGTSEIESAINANPHVAESAVVGVSHEIKGQGIYAFVVFKDNVTISKEIIVSVLNTVRVEIGPIATPDVVHPGYGLPKTRSGKIMRRILRKIAERQFDELGDISTLADPSVVQELIQLQLQWVDKKGKSASHL